MLPFRAPACGRGTPLARTFYLGGLPFRRPHLRPPSSFFGALSQGGGGGGGPPRPSGPAWEGGVRPAQRRALPDPGASAALVGTALG